MGGRTGAGGCRRGACMHVLRDGSMPDMAVCGMLLGGRCAVQQQLQQLLQCLLRGWLHGPRISS